MEGCDWEEYILRKKGAGNRNKFRTIDCEREKTKHVLSNWEKFHWECHFHSWDKLNPRLQSNAYVDERINHVKIWSLYVRLTVGNSEIFHIDFYDFVNHCRLILENAWLNVDVIEFSTLVSIKFLLVSNHWNVIQESKYERKKSSTDNSDNNRSYNQSTTNTWST